MLLYLHIRLITLVLALCGLLNIGAQMVGKAQPSKAALTGFQTDCEGKLRPCWYGIVPGETHVQEVMQIMASAGEPDVAKSIFSRDYTLIFTLPEPSPYCRLSLDFIGDIVNQGQISPCPTTDIVVGDLAVLLENGGQYISLPPNKLVYGGLSLDVIGWPEPFTPIHYMQLLAPDTPIQHFPWLGFISRRNYCRLVPDFPVCS